MGTFTSARRYVLQTFANTRARSMKKRVAQYMVEHRVPGVPRQAAAAARRCRSRSPGSTSPRCRGCRSSGWRELLRPYADGHGAGLREAGGGASRRRRWSRSASPRTSGARLDVLLDLGLGYLSLERSTPTLSPGELQRLRLATQVRSNLFGVVYVLDEPSAGLHPADTEALLAALDRLKARGQLAVRRRARARRHPPRRLDRGRRARRRASTAGEILYSGPPDGLAAGGGLADARATCSASTAPRRAHAARRRRAGCGCEGVTRNNLHDLDVDVPARRVHDGDGRVRLGQVEPGEPGAGGAGRASTSGTSSPRRTRRARSWSDGRGRRPAGASRRAWSAIKRLVRVDQKPIGRTPRSNLATYTGLFDHVRKLFAATKAARARHYDAGRFSFNVAKGRCETCEGEGFVMRRAAVPAERVRAVPDLPRRALQREDARDHVPREEHRRGAGHDGGRGVGVLRRRAARAPLARRAAAGGARLPAARASRRRSCPAARRSGSSWRPSCSATQRGNTLYVLDEPTTGLHPADVERLVAQLDGLVEAGNTVIVVEHDMRVVAASDWVIDMGPGAGDEGGRIVAAGTPREVAAAAESRTAPYLAGYLMEPSARTMPANRRHSSDAARLRGASSRSAAR